MNTIIGRQAEQQLLQDIFKKKQAAFIAIYGRRRVGKTHLVRSLFGDHENYVEITGTKDGNLSEQLNNFTEGFSEAFAHGLELKAPKSWEKAFQQLTEKIKQQAELNKKVIIFLDELPWLASPKSKLIQKLDYAWNRHWSKYDNVVLITCGSAAAWMLNNLINAKGGLHNRVTKSILLKPFNLQQTEQFLKHLKINYKRKQITDIYMAFGGIPFYLNQLEKSKSAIQNINDICFKENGLLYGEFDRVFASLFKNSSICKAITKYLALHPYGKDATSIAKHLGENFGGRLTERLHELTAAGFINRFTPIGKKKRDSYYRITDEYSSFYMQWIEELAAKNIAPGEQNYWHTQIKSSKYKAWSGFAFERICNKHIPEIQKALQLSNITCLASSWRYAPKQKTTAQGAQIDLLLDRDDGVITLCEIKYNDKPTSIDKATALNIANKVKIFEQNFKTTKQVTVALISGYGFKPTVWSEDLINQSVALDDLFDH